MPLWRGKIKPPVELVVANLVKRGGHMEIRKITEETKEEYLQVLDRDEAENIGRKY